MKRQRLAIIGFGRLGRACAEAIVESPDATLVGVVRHAGAEAAAAGVQRVRFVGHVRELEGVEAALVCVPAMLATGVARELLQQRLPVVECAMLEGTAFEAHHAAIGAAARQHRVPAVVGAGWDPGMLPLLHKAFEVLVPNGHTSLSDRPAASLHHTEAAKNVPGVRGALATEHRDGQGRLHRYVYVELDQSADPDLVRAALAGDSLFAGEDTLVFPVESVQTLEQEGHGILLERRGTARSGAHQNLLLEGRFDVATFAARVMLDAARKLPSLEAGAHRYSLWA